VEELVVAHVNVPLTPPNQVVPDISQLGSDALVQAMAKHPADRFHTYDEFIMAMQAARSQLLVQLYSSSAAASGNGKGWWKRA
jgi:hypothetical protein